MNKQKGKLGVIKEYFGFQLGQGLRDFQDECKALNDAEKTELAIGAAKNLGLTQDDVSFPLT
jgi:hypothetical protein